MKIKSYKFVWKFKWPKLLILWAIHWNETCWPVAINKIIEQIKEWKIIINSWELTLIPICNPEAFELNKRQINVNLNRIIKYNNSPKLYEELLANELIEYIDNADYILDIHSIQSKWKPFVFQDYSDKKTELFAKIIWIKNIICWWPELSRDNSCQDTITYAHSKWKIWVTIECGNHNLKWTHVIWYKSIMNCLKHFWMIKWVVNILNSYNIVNVKTAIIKKNNWDFEKKWNHLDEIKKWQIIAKYEDWEVIIMPDDWHIIMPDVNCIIWNEWFYI